MSEWKTKKTKQQPNIKWGDMFDMDALKSAPVYWSLASDCPWNDRRWLWNPIDFNCHAMVSSSPPTVNTMLEGDWDDVFI